MSLSHVSLPTIASESPRHDVYGAIHKGLRSFMQDTLFRVGCLDVAAPPSASATLEQTRGLLDKLGQHLMHENLFLHPALESRMRGGADRAASDHQHHERSLAALHALVGELDRACGEGAATAAPLAKSLYLELSGFVGENLQHMLYEESTLTRSFWAFFSDEELRAIEGAIIASETPAELGVGLRWMLPALNPTERSVLLGGARQGMPPAAFQGLLALAHDVLAPRDYDRLVATLG